MVSGNRGLQGGITLAQLLAAKRGVRNNKSVPKLTVGQILELADDHFESLGQWPNRDSGAVIGVEGETWRNLDAALKHGGRGLPRGSSLARLLAKHRSVPNRLALPNLSVEQILAWAKAHYERTNQWPIVKSGPVVDMPEEKWNNIDAALSRGVRGLPGGSSLAQLLNDHHGVRNRAGLSDFRIEQILEWADAYHDRTGKWPKLKWAQQISLAPSG